MQETVLLLGGSGFLGAHLVRAWRSLFPEMRCVVASRHPAGPASWGAWGVERPWDALDVADTERLFEEVRPRYVILSAALSRVGDCERNPELARLMNTELPGRVARLAQAYATRLVHISTDLVFGATAPLGCGFSELDGPAPLGVYGSSKAAGEPGVLDAGALVVRLPLLFGESGSGGVGASDGLFAALERGEQPGLFIDEWRTPLEAQSAARALVELALGSQKGLLHLAGAERVSRFDLGCRILHAAGMQRSLPRLRPITRAEVGQGARAADVSLDATLARSLLQVPMVGAPAAP